MWETRTISIEVQLPHDIADRAEEVQGDDPDFLSRAVLYALTRRSIYHQLRKVNDDMVRDGMAHTFTPAERSKMIDAAGEKLLVGFVPIEEDEGLRILAENRHHDGGAWADKER